MRMDVRVNCVVESVWILHFRTGDTFASYPRRFLTTAKQHYYYIIINHGDEEYIDAWPHSGYTFFLVTRMRIQRFLVFFFFALLRYVVAARLCALCMPPPPRWHPYTLLSSSWTMDALCGQQSLNAYKSQCADMKVFVLIFVAGCFGRKSDNNFCSFDVKLHFHCAPVNKLHQHFYAECHFVCWVFESSG